MMAMTAIVDQRYMMASCRSRDANYRQHDAVAHARHVGNVNLFRLRDSVGFSASPELCSPFASWLFGSFLDVDGSHESFIRCR